MEQISSGVVVSAGPSSCRGRGQGTGPLFQRRDSGEQY
ncbi:hypothetical protein E2C01_093368 [Portunus trituberculatus]|uniref:Uncharacterized protein n=1 Tax=Portunus trituberculatus TaxID=210409 RepID=A0A5B7JTC4_PORTR|nr:hypothetical protein [Portunus trituberculatus]